jgi:hypothetical protein
MVSVITTTATTTTSATTTTTAITGAKEPLLLSDGELAKT